MITISYEADVIAWANQQAQFIRTKQFDLFTSFPRSGVGMLPVTLQRHATQERCQMRSVGTIKTSHSHII